MHIRRSPFYPSKTKEPKHLRQVGDSPAARELTPGHISRVRKARRLHSLFIFTLYYFAAMITYEETKLRPLDSAVRRCCSVRPKRVAISYDTIATTAARR